MHDIGRARKTHVEETQPWWTEHESLLHACDKVINFEIQPCIPSHSAAEACTQLCGILAADFVPNLVQARNGIIGSEPAKEDKQDVGGGGPGPRRRARTVSPQARRSTSPVARRPMSPPGRISASKNDFPAARNPRKPDKAQLKSLQSAIGPDFEGEGPVEIGLDGMERVGKVSLCSMDTMQRALNPLSQEHFESTHVRIHSLITYVCTCGAGLCMCVYAHTRIHTIVSYLSQRAWPCEYSCVYVYVYVHMQTCE